MRTALIFVLISGIAFAHPGRRDENGGHRCFTNCDKHGLKYGEYHTHDEQGRAVMPEPEPPAPAIPEPQKDTPSIFWPLVTVFWIPIATISAVIAFIWMLASSLVKRIRGKHGDNL